MKILFLDINQLPNVSVISKLNTYQQVGIASAFVAAGYNIEIGVFNKIDYKPLKTFDMNIATDLNIFDIIILTNFELNFFGGKEIKSYADSFRLLHAYKGKIIYLLSDLHMEFDQYQRRHAKRFHYDLKDLFISTEVINAVHTFDEAETRKAMRRPLEKLYYFPIQYSTFYKNRDKYVEQNVLFNTIQKDFDLVYWGGWRAGRREEKMKEYLFDNNLKTLVFGALKLSNFENFIYKQAPTFLGKLSFNDLSKNGQRAYATVVFGDLKYNNNFFTTRILEALRDELILFIDNDYDKNHKLGFSEFHYINNKKELKDKIEQIKLDNNLYNNLLIEQAKYYENYSDNNFELSCKNLVNNVVKN